MKFYAWLTKPIVLFCLASSGLVFFLNQWLWPTTDEYFYAATARSIRAGLEGTVCLACLNTEHPALVASLIALFEPLTSSGPLDLIGSRLPMALFALGTILMLWLIARQMRIKAGERMWLPWLLLLLPGFFVLSARLMLDVPLTFAFAVLSYLLLSQARPVVIGLGLTLVMLTKGYGLLLAAPLVVVIFTIDSMNQQNGWLRSFIFDLPRKLLAAFLPPVIIATWLLTTSIVPYPRLLETNLIEYAGDGYIGFAKTALLATQKAAEVAAYFSFSQEREAAILKIAERQEDLEFTNQFPKALLESPLEPAAAGGFWDKLWLIYRYNFSEQDVSVFLLPLFLTGLTIRLRRMLGLGKRWLSERADQLFLLLTLIFAYLNWHEALNIHGFRLTVPLSLALVYFAYWGARAILVENSRRARWLFGLLFTGSFLLYARFILQIEGYGSVIAGQPLLALLLKYKLFIFGTAYLAAFGLIWFYPRIAWPKKPVLLAALLIGFLAIKILPFGLEAKAASERFEYDYGLAKATPFLKELVEKQEPIATNLRPYVVHYYADNLQLPNSGVYPLLREFPEIYPELVSRFYLPQRPLTRSLLEESRIRYIFYVEREVTDTAKRDFEAMVGDLNLPLEIIAEAHHPENGRLEWILYRVDANSSTTERLLLNSLFHPGERSELQQ